MKSGLLVLVLTLVLFASDYALAHSPYFTRIEPIVLPNGQPGEMSLLNGDGIVLADPARILVLDQERRLLARSYQSTSMTLLCDRERRSCWGQDGFRKLVLDPATFRSGKVVPGPDLALQGVLWKFEAGAESWGFTAQRASVIEIIRFEGAMALQWPRALAIISGLGAFATLLVVINLRWLVIGKRWQRSRAWSSLGIRTGGVLLFLMAAAVVLIPALLVAAFAGFTDTLFLLGLDSGAGMVLLVRWIWKRRRATVPSTS